VAELSIEARFMVCLVVNREAFIGKSSRKEITKENLSVGDFVFVHFPYIKNYCQGVIIGLSKENKPKIHYKGYSFRYER